MRSVTPAIAALAPAVAVGLTWILLPSSPGPARPRQRVGPDPLALLGSRVMAGAYRLVGRPVGAPPPASSARLVGVGLIVGLLAVVAVPSAPVLGVALGGLPLVVIRARRRTTADRAAGAVLDSLPEALDLLALVVGAGGTPAAAVEAVGRRGEGAVAAALAAASHRAARDGVLLADALSDVPAALGPSGELVRPLVAALADAARHGTALGPSLDRLAADARVRRRQRAEARARRVPVLLLFPLVTCTLPALGLLTIAPLLIGSLRALRHA